MIPLPIITPGEHAGHPGAVDVSEFFGPTIQGEGLDIGRPCFFLRLHHCATQCPGCFYKKTMIRMGDYSEKRISDVVLGDVVLSYDVAGGVFVPRKVTAVLPRKTTIIYKLQTTPNPRSAKTYVTGEHPVRVRDRGWVLVENLAVGDHILHLSLSELRRLHNPMHNPATVKKVSKWVKEHGGITMTKGQRKALNKRNATRMRSNNPMKDPAVAIKGFLNRTDHQPSVTEKFIQQVAGDLGVRYVGDGSLVVANKSPDFIIDGTNKLIETWPQEQTQHLKRDTRWRHARRTAFEKAGYEVLFLPVTTYKENAGERKPHLAVEREQEIKRVRNTIAEYARNGSVVYGIEKITAETHPKIWARLAGNCQSELPVYNFEVEGTHTYVANGMVVHNCDTHYTWDGTEKPQGRISCEKLEEMITHTMVNVASMAIARPLLVLSGGEPMLQYANTQLWRMLYNLEKYMDLSLETSGYVGNTPIDQRTVHTGKTLQRFLDLFDTIHLSPKITPCLHGMQTDKDLTNNVALIQRLMAGRRDALAYKFVVRDDADLDAVGLFVKEHYNGYGKVFVMPYGMEPVEIVETMKRIIPRCYQSGYTITPRLHSLMWGKARGV